MTVMENRRFQIWLVAAMVLLLMTAGIVIHFATRVPLPAHGDGDAGERGFSFLELGADSIFTRKTRNMLTDRLGPDRMEAWTPIDLVGPDARFFSELFPEVVRMNRVMEFAGGTLAGKKTLKVTYRYARNKKLPFHMIRLAFLEHTKKPLFFRAKSKGEGTVFPGLLEEKYGKPALFEGEGVAYRYWNSEDEILMVAGRKDRYGKDEYHIAIYFLDSVRALAAEVETAKNEEQKKKRGAETSAF